ncbi:GNAT family N-acetyltransferase [Saccharibacillus kuerlensis]|uniref:Ribosomal-protein-alanine acetyltransferase n=1 Tax=Saccharibacillus kuerlensis TaxID=459527 RepID=A0ABQ2KWL1_9BACL|nr:GNAT family protein [Saccharibacillus kuerlensis]GGN95422.1 putative ribosomal-protein-alanine acetyltransferase [Saccharibacillus kuerlensis]
MLTERLELRAFLPEEAEELLELRLANREFLAPLEPVRSDSYLTLAGQRTEILQSEKGRVRDQAYVYAIRLRENGQLLGRAALTGIARGPFQNASLGYFLDRTHNGHGYMTEAARGIVELAFTKHRLHRVQAGVMPRNAASLRVLEKAGFRREGLAERYLKINGVWEDHILFGITIEDWKGKEEENDVR